ncbi:MAG: hypothetical protein ABJE95_03170 [Byssovorax sp.]
MAKAGRGIHTLLTERQKAGPLEPTLDGYILELDPVITALEQGVSGQVLAVAALKALLAKVEAADIEVDTGLRHHFYYISVEAARRGGPHVAAARALEAAAFADGLSHVDDYIPDENQLCRHTISVLRSPEHAPTAAAIGLPPSWTAAWETAVNESDGAFAAVEATRAGKSIHVLAGQDAEVAFADLMIRLRKYVDSRAPRTDVVKVAQGRLLLSPLLNMLDKAKVEERARGTRKEHAKKGEDKGAPAAVVAPAVEPDKGAVGVK